MRSHISDEELEVLEQCNEACAAIVEALKPLTPTSRARVMRGVLAMHGFAVGMAADLMKGDDDP